MNTMDSLIQSKANDASILNVLMYLNIEDVDAQDEQSLSAIIKKLEKVYSKDSPRGYE